MRECEKVKDRFIELGGEGSKVREIVGERERERDLDKTKGEMLRKL